MNVVPKCKLDWLRFLLFPFKAYLVIWSLAVVIVSAWFPFHARLEMQQGNVIGLAFMVSVAVMSIAAAIQLCARQWRAAITSILFVLGTFVCWFISEPIIIGLSN